MNISPTQVTKYRQCARKIGYEYVEGFRSPPSPKQAFGREVHRHLERWLRDGVLPDESPAGLVAKQGIGRWLPPPGPELLVEHTWSIPLECGVVLSGIADCVQPPRGDELPLVIDHKSTSALKWALTPEQLGRDAQALLYATWAGLRFGACAVRARWIYYSASNPASGAPRRPTGAKPVETIIVLPDAVQIMRGVLRDVEAIVKIRSDQTCGLALPPSPASCDLYGGCYYRDKCGDLGQWTRVAAKMDRSHR